jgi:hypothetical protein
MSDLFQEKMDRLAQRVSHALDGEKLLDVATALSGLIAFAICESSASIETRQQYLDKIVEFMNKQIRSESAIKAGRSR